ncbi:MAG: DUF2284 domain-containing protein [Eggerthellaceae bacterium]|nr:DUF2284 domain-containing protein [Eggerthellaceae bacterium]
MSLVEEIIARQGFDCTGTCAASELKVREEVRAMCAVDKCHIYNTSWACPPACGDIYDFERQMHSYAHCTVVQTVMQLEDEFDGETIIEAQRVQMGRYFKMIDDFDEAGLSSEVMTLGSGHCRLCKTCTYPDAPCRFPEKRPVSMEAAGLYVAEICTKAGVPYNHGKNTIAYSSCILYN